MKSLLARPIVVLIAVIAVLASGTRASAQALTQLDRERGQAMLSKVHEDIRKYYYDSTFKGIDLKARVKVAEARIDTAKSNSEVFGVIAQMLSEFNDSHLFFIPPARAARVRHGWEMIAVGDSVYVLAVKPGSDAEQKGLRAGDLLLTVNGFQPTRENLWKLRYLYWVLRPQPVMRLTVQDPAGQSRSLEVAAEVQSGQQRFDLRNDADVRALILEAQNELDDYVFRSTKLNDVLLWQLNAFAEQGRDLPTPLRGAKDAPAVVLDLRGNSGGRDSSLIDLVGAFMDRRVLISVNRGRDETDTLWAKPARNPFKSRLVVLIDSRSGSAAEMFARVMQIETRATVVGDWSAGAVLLANGFGRWLGAGRIVPYGMMISVADVRMSDGGKLEGRGVMPDEIVVPTATDLAEGRDPALARAVALAGGSLSPTAAGRIFPVLWKK